MAKQKMNFWIKIKFIFYWLFNYTKGTMTIVKCEKCGSFRITFKNVKREGNIYTSEYTCIDCGSTATCKETWDFK